MHNDSDQTYDDIVIGAGSAGCAIASRLSEDPDRRVLLLEAGRDFLDDLPAELSNPNIAVTQGYNWPFMASVHDGSLASIGGEMKRAAGVFAAASGRLNMMKASVASILSGTNSITRFQYPMGQVLGGGSSVNGALAMVPPESDFEHWAELGNDRWAWTEMAPWFAALLDARGGSPLVEIATEGPEAFTKIQGAFHDACRAMGHPIADLSDPRATGIGGIPKNLRDGARLSSDIIYLRHARQRPNLTIIARCMAEKLLIERQGERIHATGIRVIRNGRTEHYAGANIIVSAGAINSPALLMRSGIGRGTMLRAAGIESLMELPGVGENLIDHPAVCIWGVPKAGVCTLGEPMHQALLRLGSADSDRGLQLFMLGAAPTRQFPPLHDIAGSEIAIAVSVMLGKPLSRGRVRISSPDPTGNPSIELNLLDDPDDMEQAKAGVRLGWEIVRHAALNKEIDRIVMWNQAIIDSDKQLQTMVHTTVRGSMHPVGTLRMGDDRDPIAVTDQFGQLRGSDNITIADASIMPTITTVPTNLMCLAIGERIAAHLRR